MNVTILGTGSWGSALAQVLVDNGHTVKLWGINEAQVNDINQNHKNSAFFPNTLPEQLSASLDISIVKDANVLLLAVPSIALEETIQKALPYLPQDCIYINVAKGFHPTTHERLSLVLQKSIPTHLNGHVVSLIGPSHAEEVINRKLTIINAVSEDDEINQTVQNLFSNDYFRVYRNNDVIGAEIGVAIKNIMAIASGILEGVGQGDNARAALITRGLAEMTRFGIACGGKQETFLGLDGVGDLIVTCTSKHSRNFMAGYQIGCDGGAKQFMQTNQKTVEGIYACKIVEEMAQQMHVEMPIVHEVYQVLFEEKKPSDAIASLMQRELKPESNQVYQSDVH